MKTAAMVLLLVGVGLAGCTDGKASPDEDGDGLTNQDEARGWIVNVETMSERLTYEVDSDPKLADTDGDGLLDVYEATFGLDPRKADSDEDGLTDCQEVQHTNRSECEDLSFEGETDGGYGTSPTLADSDASASRYVNGNPDMFSHRSRNEIGQVPRGDGIGDGEEVAGFTLDLGGRSRFVQTDPLRVDTDGDSLEDGEERFVYQTDPLVPDTDGDGCDDGWDMIPGAAERYQIELVSFTWFEAGRSGSTHIALPLNIVDHSLAAPPGEPVAVPHGQEVDISHLSPAPVPVYQCSYEANRPWFRIDLQVAEFRDGRFVGSIDVHSQSVPNGNVSVWMHARTHEYRWDPETAGGPPAGLLTWRGSEAEVVFQPRVLPA